MFVLAGVERVICEQASVLFDFSFARLLPELDNDYIMLNPAAMPLGLPESG